MNPGSVIVDVSSNSAYILPSIVANKKTFALATVADERNGYLAGVDVLVDGGSVIGKDFIKTK